LIQKKINCDAYVYACIQYVAVYEVGFMSLNSHCNIWDALTVF